jgi:hypothetical protein
VVTSQKVNNATDIAPNMVVSFGASGTIGVVVRASPSSRGRLRRGARPSQEPAHRQAGLRGQGGVRDAIAAAERVLVVCPSVSAVDVVDDARW